MSEPIFTSQGNLHLGPVGRRSLARIVTDFRKGDHGDGVVLDAGVNADGAAFVKLGDFKIGSDSTGALVVQDSAGTKLSDLTAFDPTVATAPVVLYQFDIPLIIAPSGNFGTNGSLVSGTANPLTYLKTFTWFPEGAIQAADAGPPVIAASPAGWYYTVWTTTTAATVYQETWNGASEPTVPATATPWVCADPGASFTGPTTAAVYFTLPFDAAGVHTRFDVEARTHQTNNGNVKTFIARMTDGSGTVLATWTLTSFLHNLCKLMFKNNGVADKQERDQELVSAAAIARGTPALSAETLSADFAIAFTYAKATATDVAVIESLRITRSR